MQAIGPAVRGQPPADGRSSLYDDLAAGRRIELEALHGAVVRRARKLSVELPACESIYGLLAPWARKLES